MVGRRLKLAKQLFPLNKYQNGSLILLWKQVRRGVGHGPCSKVEKTEVKAVVCLTSRHGLWCAASELSQRCDLASSERPSHSKGCPASPRVCLYVSKYVWVRLWRSGGGAPLSAVFVLAFVALARNDGCLCGYVYVGCRMFCPCLGKERIPLGVGQGWTRVV